MQILLIVAHGSKLKESNDEIINLSQSIETLVKEKYDVRYAYLELASPSLQEVLNEILEYDDNASIKVLPYFLARGKHVKHDIPNCINEFKQNYPNSNITVLPHLGKTNGLANLIIQNYIIN